MEQRDIVIVGAGPAGSSCAWRLRRAGLDVLLLDRRTFPRDKTCAGWITPGVLESVGVTVDEYARQHLIEPIRAFRVGVIGGRSADVAFGRPVSHGIRRSELDHFLVQRCGAEFRPGTAATSIRREGVRWIVNESIEAAVLVGAGGHFCPVARALNESARAEAAVVTTEAEVKVAADDSGDCRIRPGVPEFYFSPDFMGYGWVLRKGSYVTVGIGRQDPHRLRDHARAFLEFLRREHRLPDMTSAAWKGHAYLLYGASPRRVVDQGILLVGDAAGCARPRSGEGIGPAIESGLIAAETIVDARRCRGSGLDAYPRRLEQAFGPAGPWSATAARLPVATRNRVGRRLVGSRWFARRIVVRKWFLRQ